MERSVLPSFKAFPLSKSSAGNGVLSHVSHCERDIRVLSYNVLAQCKAKRSVYPYCHPSFLNRNHRLQATLEQIREVDAHVVCLQDADYYESWWHPQLQRLGYDGLFNSSGSFTKSGVALFYKREVFQLFQSENVNFNDVAKFLHDEKGSSRYIQNNVGVIAALQPWEDSRHPTAICVTSVCLCNPAVGDDAMLKLHDMQHQMLLRKIEEFNASFHLPVVICGTFNALPRSKNHRLMISGAYGRVVETPHVLEKRPWAEPLGRSQVKVSWDRAPYCGDTPITGYVVKRRGKLCKIFYQVSSSAILTACNSCFAIWKAGGNGSFQFPVHFQNENTQSVVVCGLSSGTTYEFIVAANSYAGVGDFSQPTKPVKTQSNPRYPPRSRYLQHPEEAATLKYSHHLAKQEDWYEYEKTVNASSEPGDFRRTGSTPRYESSQVNLDIANRTDIRNGRRMPNVVHSLQLKSLYATQKDQVENPTRITEKVRKLIIV